MYGGRVAIYEGDVMLSKEILLQEHVVAAATMPGSLGFRESGAQHPRVSGNT